MQPTRPPLQVGNFLSAEEALSLDVRPSRVLQSTDVIPMCCWAGIICLGELANGARGQENRNEAVKLVQSEDRRPAIDSPSSFFIPPPPLLLL